LDPLFRKAALATLIFAPLAVVVALLQWQYPKLLPSLSGQGVKAAASATPPGQVEEPKETGQQTPPRGGSYPPQEPKAPTPEPPSKLPVEFSLSDGEQRVVLAGQAGVAAEFGRVGDQEFVTIRIHSGGKRENHAVLEAGARFEFAVQDQVFYLSVLKIDSGARTVRLRIDRKGRMGGE
jgi:hypothetical protein